MPKTHTVIETDSFKMEQTRTGIFDSHLQCIIQTISPPHRGNSREANPVSAATASSQTCNRNIIDIMPVFACQSLILAPINSASKYECNFALFHKFSPMLVVASAKENLSLFQTEQPWQECLWHPTRSDSSLAGEVEAVSPLPCLQVARCCYPFTVLNLFWAHSAC